MLNIRNQRYSGMAEICDLHDGDVFIGTIPARHADTLIRNEEAARQADTALRILRKAVHAAQTALAKNSSREALQTLKRALDQLEKM